MTSHTAFKSFAKLRCLEIFLFLVVGITASGCGETGAGVGDGGPGDGGRGDGGVGDAMAGGACVPTCSGDSCKGRHVDERGVLWVSGEPKFFFGMFHDSLDAVPSRYGEELLSDAEVILKSGFDLLLVSADFSWDG